MSPLEQIAAGLRELFREVLREERGNDDLLDVDGAAKLLHRSPAAIRKAVSRGQLPCVRVGRQLRFQRAALLALAKSQ